MSPIRRSAAPPLELDDLLRSRQIIVCVGAGGVGKTTIAATMAVRAARIGLRAACLTIDPARRLADSLGVEASENGGQLQDITKTLGEPVKKGGRLSFGMLDPKATFDQFVLDRATDAETASQILDNRLYRYISGSLSGMQEYMALEKLCEIKDEGGVDIIIVDTPPTANAIDFFTAPGRVVEALDGPLVRVMRRAYSGPGRIGLDMVGRWAGAVLRTMSKVTGAELLSEIMGFVDALSDLFGNFSERAASVEEVLKADAVAICLVSTPERATLREAKDFRQRLEQLGLNVHMLIFNRCHYPRVEYPACEIPIEAKDDIHNLIDEWNKAFDSERKIIEHVREAWDGLEHVALVPTLPTGATRISALNVIGGHLRNTGWDSKDGNVSS